MTQEEAIERIKYLTAELNRHNYLYYVKNNPEISDYEFDQLMKELEELEKNIIIVNQIVLLKEWEDLSLKSFLISHTVSQCFH